MKTSLGCSQLQELSRSSNTVVYRGRRDLDDTAVVIKMLAGSETALSFSIDQLARLQHEFELLRQVDSPHVVKALDLLELHPGLALVLEDKGGQPIARRSGFTASLTHALRIACDVLRGLAALHRRGIVHRNINP